MEKVLNQEEINEVFRAAAGTNLDLVFLSAGF